MNIDDFSREYRSKSDDELLRLCSQSHELVEAARVALQDELRQRNLNDPSIVADFQREQERLKRDAESEIGLLGTTMYFGFGRNRFGKSAVQSSHRGTYEEFTTTVFLTFLWLPIVPLGTYRVRRKKKWSKAPLQSVARLALDWEQILTIWVVASAVVLAVIWCAKLYLRFA